VASAKREPGEGLQSELDRSLAQERARPCLIRPLGMERSLRSGDLGGVELRCFGIVSCRFPPFFRSGSVFLRIFKSSWVTR
jgi:hypothetical protein